MGKNEKDSVGGMRKENRNHIKYIDNSNNSKKKQLKTNFKKSVKLC